MASTFKRVAWASIGNQLTTELNSLGNGAYSALSAAYDNTSGLYLYGSLEINLASLNPTAGAYLQIFMAQSLDGTNYEDIPGTTNPGYHMALPLISVTTGSAAKRIITPVFNLPGGKVKFSLLNGTGVSLAASSNTVALSAGYDQAV